MSDGEIRMPSSDDNPNSAEVYPEDIYGPKVSADLITCVTDAVLAGVSDWHNRALEPMYPIAFLDALRVKVRDAENRQVKNKAVYLALGITPKGERAVFGLWNAANEGAKYWLSVMINLRDRGAEDILIAVLDGLKSFYDAINAAFPETKSRPASCVWCGIH